MIDLRDEPCLGFTERVFSLGKPSIMPDDLRLHDDLSANAQKMATELSTPEFAEAVRLRNIIEGGNATGSDDEVEAVYDAYVLMTDRVLDLFAMVSRRDEQIALLRVEIQLAAADVRL